MPSPDTIDEFKIETSNFDAAFGHSTGLTIAMSTKSGSNVLRGTGTVRCFNQDWNEPPYFVKQARAQQLAAAQAAGSQAEIDRLNATPLLPPGEMQNYHASIGGPVYLPGVFDGRNRLFFFFGFSS